jgi:hypothetical protein
VYRLHSPGYSQLVFNTLLKNMRVSGAMSLDVHLLKNDTNYNSIFYAL